MRGAHIAHISDLDNEAVTTILDEAESFVPAAQGKKRLQTAAGKVLATLFFEPSTRTRLSFETAMHRLGGAVITVAEPGGTSTSKGETLADTIRTAAGYADAIVLRHPREGAARLAAKLSSVPIINGGDGAGQHPTQTLTDLFTIRRAKGQIGSTHVTLAGDLKYGRTVHSLALALARYGASMSFVAPPNLRLPDDIIAGLDEAGAEYTVHDRLEDALGQADILYMTRIQRERFPDADEYAKVAGVFRVNKRLLAEAKKGISVMHPLPRVDEIAPEVDQMPAALYFEQAANGVPVRMAILRRVLGLEVGA